MSAIFAFGIAAGASCSAEPSGSWFGHYTYSFDAGRNRAGTGVVVDYAFDLGSNGCSFTAEGYQADEQIFCKTVSFPGKIVVEFQSYRNGKITDDRGNSPYQVGESLFFLRLQGQRLLTHWDSYTLPDEKPHPLGVYFKRIR